jgi:hypothetical protein
MPTIATASSVRPSSTSSPAGSRPSRYQLTLNSTRRSEALGRGRKDMRAEVRAILVARDAPDPPNGGRRERAEAALAGRGKDDAGARVDLVVRDHLADLPVVVLV